MHPLVTWSLSSCESDNCKTQLEVVIFNQHEWEIDGSVPSTSLLNILQPKVKIRQNGGEVSGEMARRASFHDIARIATGPV
jgi:hypothetical protein